MKQYINKIILCTCGSLRILDTNIYRVLNTGEPYMLRQCLGCKANILVVFPAGTKRQDITIL